MELTVGIVGLLVNGCSLFGTNTGGYLGRDISRLCIHGTFLSVSARFFFPHFSVPCVSTYVFRLFYSGVITLGVLCALCLFTLSVGRRENGSMGQGIGDWGLGKGKGVS